SKLSGSTRSRWGGISSEIIGTSVCCIAWGVTGSTSAALSCRGLDPAVEPQDDDVGGSALRAGRSAHHRRVQIVIIRARHPRGDDVAHLNIRILSAEVDQAVDLG